MRLLLFGDGAWATNSLLRLQETQHRIVGVVVRSQPSDMVLWETARTLGLPVLQPQNANASDFLAAVTSLAPDLNLSISYNQILRPPILSAARLGCVNVHAGKLPFYRGRNVINWAIINGETEIGLTTHFMDAGIDTGDIILQRTLPIHWTDTYGDVLSRVVETVPDLVLESIDLIASGQAKPWRQAHLPGTYFSGREDGDEWLDWSDTSYNLYNKVRAISRPGPGARTLLGDNVVLIWRTFYDRSWPKYIATPGQVVGRQNEGVLVKTGDSTLLVQEVQRMGGACEVPSWPIGTRLGIDLISSLRSIMARLEALEQQRSGREDSHGES
jgi:methionyl-tRNA formyltransferase